MSRREQDDEARLRLALAREGGQVMPFPSRAPEPFMRRVEAAAHLGVSISTLQRWERQGLPSARVGGVRLYRAPDLAAWVAER